MAITNNTTTEGRGFLKRKQRATRVAISTNLPSLGNRDLGSQLQIKDIGSILVQRRGAKGEAVQIAPRTLRNEVHAPKSADINV
ncbi:MAG: hypothetical protein WC047_05350 [Kiritimatiellales bacterium]